MKSREYAQLKIARLPNLMSKTDAEMRKLLEEASLDAEDILELLEGHNIHLLDMEDITACDCNVLLEGIKKHYDSIRENGGQDGAILMWQYNGGFDPDASPLSRLVAGQKVDFRQVKGISEIEFKSCLIKYFEMLRNEKRH